MTELADDTAQLMRALEFENSLFVGLSIGCSAAIADSGHVG